MGLLLRPIFPSHEEEGTGRKGGEGDLVGGDKGGGGGGIVTEGKKQTID